jgi:transposase
LQPTIIGVDLAKSVFQVHGVDAHGEVIVTRRLRRDGVLSFFANLPACIVGMEACATAHHWAREISKLGHTVHLMPPQYVKPYVKRHKNDQADAEAVCEAAQHALDAWRIPCGHVPIKTAEQQSTLVIHRVWETLVGQKTQLINALRGHLAEFGIVAPQGAHKVAQLTMRLADPGDDQVPAAARSVLQVLVDQLRETERRIAELDARLVEQAKQTSAAAKTEERGDDAGA